MKNNIAEIGRMEGAEKMDYEFHVGDYVETIGGFVGWISVVRDNGYIIIIDKYNNSCGYHMPQESRYFVRIGQYDFTEK